VQIGTQCWTKTNLRSTKDRNGNLFINGMTAANYDGYVDSVVYIPTPAAWNENHPSVTYDAGTFGYYYNWVAANNVCPDGWHLPSAEEWTQLEDYVSNAQEGTEYIYRCDQSGATSIAKALASETDVWNSYAGECYPGDQSVNQNNATGFSAVPAGYFYGSSFDRAGDDAYFWSSTQSASYPNDAYYRNLYYHGANVLRRSNRKYLGYSVRCLRDAEPGGEEPGGEEPTSFNCGEGHPITIGSNSYETVQIGTQCWTKTNMRETKDKNGNDFINGLTAAAGSFYDDEDAVIYIPTEEKWNVNNSSVTYDENTFGYYYNWVAANNVCPDGWHLPSDEEWNTMEATVSGSDWQTSYETSRGWRGDHAGKLAGGDSWHTSSTANAPGNTTYSGWGASGFSAVPAGLCSGSSFFYAGDCAYFWSSTQDGARNLYYGYAGVSRYYNYKSSRYSVRCLRDAEE